MAASKTEAEAVAPLLTREALLNADDRREGTVEVPEWGGSVKCKALSLGQWQDAMDGATVNGVVDEGLAAMHTLVEGVIEPKLTRDDIAVLRTKSTTAIMTVMSFIAELSGVDPAAVKEAEATFPAAS